MHPHALDAILFPIQLGGHPALNFTNTIEFRQSEKLVEFLSGYVSVLAWCKQSDLITPEETQKLDNVAQVHPEQAEAIFYEALTLREKLYELFSTFTDEDSAPADATFLNQALQGCSSFRQIALCDGRGEWIWAGDEADLSRILWPIVWSAGELLTSETITQIRKCPNCGWLFIDTSRNHSRRWCSMDFCGSKIKSRRQYERKKGLEMS